jgi:hypothetical protein
LDLFEQYINRAIAARRPDLQPINDLKNIANLYFNADQYPEVLRSLLAGRMEDIPPQVRSNGFREYLHAYSFADNSGKKYLGTFYDSDLLEQDPQVIDIVAYPSHAPITEQV